MNNFLQEWILATKKTVDQNFVSKQIKAELGDYNEIKNKIEQKGLNNLKQSQNTNKNNPTNYFETFNNLAMMEIIIIITIYKKWR